MSKLRDLIGYSESDLSRAATEVRAVARWLEKAADEAESEGIELRGMDAAVRAVEEVASAILDAAQRLDRIQVRD